MLGRAGLIAFLHAAPIALAAEPPDHAAALAANPDDESIPEQPQLWFQTFEPRLGAGFKDNLLLDSRASEQSGFVSSGLDWFVGRLPLDGRQFSLLLTGDDTRYFEGRTVDHEDLAAAFAQVKLDLSPRWRLGADLRYVYQDQVLDTSVTEKDLTSAPVRGHSAAVMPNARWTFARDFWVELTGNAQRQYFSSPFDDYWEGGPKITVGHDYGQRSSIAWSGGFNHRAYDTRHQVSVSRTNSMSGTNSLIITDLPGTSLRFDQADFELNWNHNWDARRRWRTTVRLGLQLNADNGPGFYDYRRYLVAPQLRYVAPTWEARAQARLSFYDFQHQPASLTDPDDPDLRQKTIVSLGARAEKTVWKQLKLFAEYEHELSLSNRDVDEYHVNKISGGVSREF